MTHLRQLMIEELQRRNFAESTIRSYVHGVEHFSQYFHRRPDRLGPQHIREYQAMLFSKLKYSPNTVIQRLGALRFFYIKVLKKNWSIAETPYPPDESTFLMVAVDMVHLMRDRLDSPYPTIQGNFNEMDIRLWFFLSMFGSSGDGCGLL